MAGEKTSSDNPGFGLNNLPDQARKNPFDVPKGYFEDLQSRIVAKKDEEEIKDALKGQPSGMKTPDGYFNSLQERILQRVEEEKSEAPDLPKASPFEVPEGYFAGLEKKITEKISEPEKAEKGRVIALHPVYWVSLAAAAAVALLFLLPTEKVIIDAPEVTAEELSSEDADLFLAEAQIVDGEYLDEEQLIAAISEEDLEELYKEEIEKEQWLDEVELSISPENIDLESLPDDSELPELRPEDIDFSDIELEEFIDEF